MTRRATTWMSIFVLAGAAAVLSADTLVMRNGQRIDGELLSVKNGTVEFRESGGFLSRTLRVDRRDVDRIELDDRSSGSSGNDTLTGGGRPAGMREKEVVVSADVPWNDSGIDVRSGQTVYFAATGTVRWGKDRRDGPEGEKKSPYNANRPMPSRPAAALIGRIGTGSSDIFFIGAEQGAFRMRASGRLFLGINDDVIQDNSQNFRVVVSY